MAKVIENILRYFADALGVQQGLLILGRAELFLILLGFNILKLRAHIVVVHLELEHLFITNGVGDHIGMQFRAKNAGGGFRAQGILWKDRRAGKAKLTITLKFILQILLRLAKLATVAFIKNENHLLVINRQITLAFHQVVELLDGGDDDLVVILAQVALEPGGAVGAVHAIG